ncbi:hypothetical protein CF326_g5911 [Tilletia indica]|nr:hypothetical protein CF326_g5911 [Tilletia indica]
MDGMRTRIEKEITLAYTAIDRKMEFTVKAVEDVLSECGEDSGAEIGAVVDSFNACGAALQRDVNCTENDYMKTLAHTVVSTSYASTRPLVGSIPSQPPQYVSEVLSRPTGERDGQGGQPDANPAAALVE